jgi:hypothetical protein
MDRVIDERPKSEILPDFHALDVGEYFEFIDQHVQELPACLYQKTGDTTSRVWYLRLDDIYPEGRLSCSDVDLTDSRFHKVRRVYVEWTVRLSYEPFKEVNDEDR